ncbi:hypothetical protein JVU11DRAFT_12460 [Chiua virens]|nr:hypothetical protein JVU11DRAFT_12460 [Chiua virens]
MPGIIERFNAPHHNTQIAYASEEVRLLCFVFRCHLKGICYLYAEEKGKPDSKGPGTGSKFKAFRLPITKQLQKALKDLEAALRLSSESPPSQTSEALDNVLEALYLPNNTLDLFQDRYADPVAIFTTLRAIHKDGGFNAPELLTCLAVRIQFCIRLFILDFLNRGYTRFKKACQDNNREESDADTGGQKDLGLSDEDAGSLSNRSPCGSDLEGSIKGRRPKGSFDHDDVKNNEEEDSELEKEDASSMRGYCEDENSSESDYLDEEDSDGDLTKVVSEDDDDDDDDKDTKPVEEANLDVAEDMEILLLTKGLKSTGQTWAKYVESIIREWCSELKPTPFGTIREWIRSLSRVVRNTPARANILWLSDSKKGDAVRVWNHTVYIDSYLAAVQKTLEECLTHLQEKVFLGLDVVLAGLPAEDLQDEHTKGFSLFPLDLEADITQANEFLNRLCMATQIGLCQKDEETGDVVWNVTLLQTWLQDISRTWSSVYVLMHLLSPPARGTEEEMWQHSNSPESPRHLFYSQNLQTLVTKSNYNKTSSTASIYKAIIRVIPYKLALILATLLQIVRPVELAAVLQFQSGSPERALEVASLYQTRLFVSSGQTWTAEGMSQALHSWFKEKLEVPFSLRYHRQFAKALQRKYFSFQQNQVNSESAELAWAANSAFGHNEETGEMHYARLRGSLGVPQSVQEKYEMVGVKWIEWHGLQPSP